MAIKGTAVRDVYESFVNRGEGGRRQFYEFFMHGLGIRDENGRPYRNVQKGRQVLESEKRKFRPEDVSLLDLAMGLTGLWGEGLRNAMESYARHGGRNPTADVLEASGGTAVTPTQFANISVYNAAVAGLLEAKVLEVYDRPEYIGDRLARTIPTRKRTEKFIGLVESGDTDVVRKPTERHARVNLAERYQETPETQNRGLAIEVSREAALFDETNLVLQYAEGVADRLRLRKEKALIDQALGITNNYSYGGTTYNTYVASDGLWVNVKASNPLADWRDVDEALQLFVDMTDPENGEPIVITARQILAMPQKAMTIEYLLNATETRHSTNSAVDLQVGPNPLKGRVEVLPTSPWVYRRATDTDGLALTADNAANLWFLGDFQKAFAYMENFPLTIVRAAPSDYEMADRGLVAAIFIDEMGIPAVLQPRAVVKNKNEA